MLQEGYVKSVPVAEKLGEISESLLTLENRLNQISNSFNDVEANIGKILKPKQESVLGDKGKICLSEVGATIEKLSEIAYEIQKRISDVNSRIAL